MEILRVMKILKTLKETIFLKKNQESNLSAKIAETAEVLKYWKRKSIEILKILWEVCFPP